MIQAEINALESIRLDSNFEQAVNLILSTNGKLITTGLGKAGHIATKAAATFSSTGTPSVFLHPSEAGHGDLGVVSPQDCILAYSTSGKTREIIETLKLSKIIGVQHAIGITSHIDSELRGLCDVVIDMGVINEPCPLGLTPTASSTVMLAISDAIAMCLMKHKEFTKHDYGLRHHAGYLGAQCKL